MIIAIDESGSFVSSNTTNSWCVVAAYVFSERIKSRSFAALKKLKRANGVYDYEEIKLKNVTERNYFQFLIDLSKLNGVLFAVATDSHINTNDALIEHRTVQANKIRENVPRMIYEEGKKGITILADEIESLSPQLYAQLQCQIALFGDIFHRAILYYVQRDPYTLRKYKWRIDQKNTTKSVYEKSFEKVICPILQSISFSEPMIFLEGADYNHMNPFIYSDGEVPEYIEEAYGKKLSSGVNIGKMIRDDIDFPNSKLDMSVQIADLLAAGIRRCLRLEFSDNSMASKLLGRLMLGNIKGKYPIQFVGFGKGEETVDDKVARVMAGFERTSKGILTNA
ncbi:DUF3800 domain-containing protein [Gynuella sunshinyii]|nr:DUF3800 domain-containing protein [Gynuella sunshinyii]